MRGCTYASICRSPSDLAVVAMASETLQTKSKARRDEFVFGASMSVSAIMRQSRFCGDRSLYPVGQCGSNAHVRDDWPVRDLLVQWTENIDLGAGVQCQPA